MSKTLGKMFFAAAKELLKTGKFKEIGSFAPGEGYIIAEYASAEEAFREVNRFYPMILAVTREIISWEKTKEMVQADLKAKINAMKK